MPRVGYRRPFYKTVVEGQRRAGSRDLCSAPAPTASPSFQGFPSLFLLSVVVLLHTAMSSSDWQIAYDPLVPIRVQIERLNGDVILENFHFNLEDPDISPASVAALLVRDHRLPPWTYLPVLTDCIAHQISYYSPLTAVRLPARKLGVPCVAVIRLAVLQGDRLLQDRFEWDLLNPFTDIDTYADTICADLHLDRRWAVGVAFQMRERIFDAKKQLRESIMVAKPRGGSFLTASTAASAVLGTTALISQYVTGGLVPTDMLREEEQAALWGPSVEIMTEKTFRKWETDMQREDRARRRKADSLMFAPPSIVEDPESRMAKLVVPQNSPLFLRIHEDHGPAMLFPSERTMFLGAGPSQMPAPPPEQHPLYSHVGALSLPLPNDYGLLGLTTGVPFTPLVNPVRDDHLRSATLLLDKSPSQRAAQRFVDAARRYFVEHASTAETFPDAIAEFSRRLRAGQIRWQDYSTEDCPIRF